MKKTVLITVILLGILLVSGVLTAVTFDDSGDAQAYGEALSNAEDYMNRGLYQLAIKEYEKADGLHDSEELRGMLLDAYGKRYAESSKILDDYLDAANSASKAYPHNVGFLVTYAKLCTESDRYQDAYRALENGMFLGLSGEEFEELFYNVKYACEVSWNTSQEIMPESGGYYAVMNSSSWSYKDLQGNSLDSERYDFVSPTGDEGIAVKLRESNAIIEDSEGIVRGKLSFVPAAAGAYSEGLIAIDGGTGYSYYNSLGDAVISSSFASAGNFSGGMAPAAQSEGSWVFIDAQANILSQAGSYDAVAVDGSGKWIGPDGLFSVVKSGAPALMKIVEGAASPVGGLSADELGVCVTDGPVAFRRGELWGFADRNGNEIISPRYEDAKSFSKGLAAVKQDGQWGFIDETGRLVIECSYVDADYFNSEHYCFVKTTENEWQMLKLKVRF